MTSYNPDEKPQNQDETSIHFKHDAGLSFTLVYPPKGPSSFSKHKPLARLYLKETKGQEESLRDSSTLSSQEDHPYWKGPTRVARSSKNAIQSYEGDLTREKLDEIIASTARASAVTYVHALLNRRDYAKAEVEDKLLSAGYDKQIVQDVVKRAQDGNLINDERFSEVFIRSKLLDGWGPRKIQLALAKRGIVLDEVKGWPEEFIQRDEEVERAFSLIKHRSALRKNPFEKSVRFLAAKGFSYDICKQAAQRLVEELGAQDE